MYGTKKACYSENICADSFTRVYYLVVLSIFMQKKYFLASKSVVFQDAAMLVRSLIEDEV